MLSIQKYGGSSIASVKAIDTIAQKLIFFSNNGVGCIVIVSAMGDTTDQLIALANKIDAQIRYSREYDMLISVGERISMTLLALAIIKHGGKAISYTGSQAGIITSSQHGNARIADVSSWRIKKAVESGYIVVVAGFQGYSKELDSVTTLGRGGSDTTAIAIAHYMKQKICDIYTDVDGIFTVDPNISSKARLIEEIDYDNMLLLANRGAKVLSASSIEYARDNSVKIHISNSYSQSKLCINHVQGVQHSGSIVGRKSEKNLGVCITGRRDMTLFIFNIIHPNSFSDVLSRLEADATRLHSANVVHFTRGEQLFIAIEKEHMHHIEKNIPELQKKANLMLSQIVEDRSEVFVVNFSKRCTDQFCEILSRKIEDLKIDFSFIEGTRATLYLEEGRYFETINLLYNDLCSI